MTTEQTLVLSEIDVKTKEELIELARVIGFEFGSSLADMGREELAQKLLFAFTEGQGILIAKGILDVMNEGYGFLRQRGVIRAHGKNVYISQSQIRRFGLRTGDMISGQVRPPKDSERYFGLIRVQEVNGVEPDVARTRRAFEDLTPVFPDKIIKMETTSQKLSTRLIDVLAPIGRGQRGLIVSPPKAGKTMLLKEIANGVTANHKDIHLMVALVGERPEEVTDVTRSVAGEVFSSTFDEPVEDHCRIAELALERSKRLAESGTDVVLLVDSVTRLTRAYNLAVPSSGRTLSGGVDPVALYPPKKFFGTARNTEGGGSITIIATCLVDTGSRMDEVIYEEFKGTGNWELHLDRKLAERRVFPAIDIQRSGTRREDLLLDKETMRQVVLLRRMVSMITSDGLHYNDATEKLLDRLSKTKDNVEFLSTLTKEI